MNFQQRMQELLSENKLSRNRLAQLIGVHTSTVTGWIQGREPQVPHQKKLMEYFDVSRDYLMGDSDIKKPIEEQKEKAPISNEDLKFALFGRTDIDDKTLNAVKKFARFVDEGEDDE